MVIALAAETQTIWWITLGVGLVVAVVVVTLLQMLLTAVNRVDRSVATLWHTATSVARNTATTWQLETTQHALTEIKTEALRHNALLSSDGQPATRPVSRTERET